MCFLSFPLALLLSAGSLAPEENASIQAPPCIESGVEAPRAEEGVAVPSALAITPYAIGPYSTTGWVPSTGSQQFAGIFNAGPGDVVFCITVQPPCGPTQVFEIPVAALSGYRYRADPGDRILQVLVRSLDLPATGVFGA